MTAEMREEIRRQLTPFVEEMRVALGMNAQAVEEAALAAMEES